MSINALEIKQTINYGTLKLLIIIEDIENNSGNVRELWKTINDLMSRKIKSNTINELKVNNLSFTEPSESADELNKHFTEVGLTLASTYRRTTAILNNIC